MSEQQVILKLLLAFGLFLLSVVFSILSARDVREQGPFNEESMHRYVKNLIKTNPEKASKIRTRLKYDAETYRKQLSFYMLASFVFIVLSWFPALSLFKITIEMIESNTSTSTLVQMYTEKGLFEATLIVTFVFATSVFKYLHAIARRNHMFSRVESI